VSVDALTRTRRLALALAAACVALAIGCAVLLGMVRSARGAAGGARYDEGVRRAAVAELVRDAGVWDGAFPDVGHLLAPGLVERDYSGFKVTSDAAGLREREIELPKPAGTVRVVLLGDSFVMGHGVAADERFGVFLERFLSERAAAPAPRIEVLHVGVDVWNIHAECAFLRRALTPIGPDLVIHVLIGNDVDDNPGVRGFGALTTSDPIHPDRPETLFRINGPGLQFGFEEMNFLTHGADLESRERYARAAADVEGLARAVAAAGGRYFVVNYFGPLLPVARARLLGGVAPERQLALPNSFVSDHSLHVSASDLHWNRNGNERVAQMLYAAIRERSLLAGLQLAAWPEAEALLARIAAEGAAEAGRDPEQAIAGDLARIAPSIDFERLDAAGAAQIHGGVTRGGIFGPYASVILRAERRRALLLEGARVKRRELAGARARVSVEEAAVGEFDLGGKGPIAERFAIPAEIAARRFVTVTIVSSEFAAGGPDLKLPLCFQLRRLAVE
jgi:hypothetical protein